jgi:hypothetical protein
MIASTIVSYAIAVTIGFLFGIFVYEPLKGWLDE